MGGSSWSSDAYSNLRSNYSNLSSSQIFTSKTINKSMSPYKLGIRESRDSSNHPDSLAIIVALDETGSMGKIPEYLIKNKLGTLMETLISHQIPDAQVMFLGVGDHISDTSPLQVGQFESGTEELNQWLTSIFLEGKGGGNGGESYPLAWLIAGRHTSIDCLEKRGQKGFLFTIGDENFHDEYSLEALKTLMGNDDLAINDNPDSFLSNLFGIIKKPHFSARQLLEEAQRLYHVFHLIVNNPDSGIINNWRNLMGENAIVVDNYDNVAELIASTVALVQGAHLDAIVSDFSDSAKHTVSTSLAKLKSNLPMKNNQDGIFRL